MNTADKSISLAGKWQVRLDPKIIGLSENWMAADMCFDESITLPGTTDEAGLGTPLTMKPDSSKEGLARLHRKNSFIGPAWYRRSIEIPPEWQGRRVTLELERVLWESQGWLDGREIGKQNSLSAPHVFEFSDAAIPGRHELVIRVDNSQIFDIGRSHAYVEDTQSIWNGIVGKIELHSTSPVWIDSVRIEPDPARAGAEIRIGNTTGKSGEGLLTGNLSGPGLSEEFKNPVRWDAGGGSVVLDFKNKNLPLWSEFHPNLCKLELTLENRVNGNDHKEVAFGFRKIAAGGSSLRLNDLPVFLRGTHEGASFPLTGYPPMNVEGWRRIFQIIKKWGLNHMRFHSYCPPEACFTAADEEGVYLQAELPLWTEDMIRPKDNPALVRWVREEAARILAAYGNHPSLVLFCLGNELHGQYAFMQDLLGELQKADPRRLYTMTSNRLWVLDAPDRSGQTGGPAERDDFLVERALRVDGNIEGMRGQSFFNAAPNTSVDFSALLARTSLPLITHEIGQWTIFPNLAEIPKYTGVLRPVNLEGIRDDLKMNGLLAQAADFTRVSGKFAAVLYKQELELALRSKPLAGYQLLDLHDYPGQGTAHVGLLDSFWDTKGLVEPSWFREAAAPVVPLVRMPKRVYTSDETFAGTVEFVNFSGRPIPGVQPTWELTAPDLGVIARGTLPALPLPIGAGIPAGGIRATLGAVTKPTEALLRVTAPDAGASNSWNIWIVPPKPEVDAKDVHVTTSLDDAKRALREGGNVLYLPGQDAIRQHQETAFLPAFWSPVYFTSQAGTMGLLIQNSHPALACFSTADHCDWQWWSILTPSPCAVVLDHVTPGLQPIVQVIDSFARNQKLGLVFDAKVGEGHLVVCAAKLEGDGLKDPMRGQLRSSLTRYLSGAKPTGLATLSGSDLDKLFRDTLPGQTDSPREWSKDLEPPPARK